MPKIVGNYLDISDCNINRTKIYTTKFCGLLGQDRFNKKGDMILRMFKILDGGEFDQFYTKRGELAERYVKDMLVASKLEHDWYGAETTTFDMFENPAFGGNLDFKYKYKGEDISLEVKSKNIKYYNFIGNNGADKTHTYQARLGAFLGGIKRVKIVYVFFDDKQERAIKETQNLEDLRFKLGELKTVFVNVPIDEERLKKEMKQAYDYYDECFKNKRVPLSDISDGALQELGLEREIDIFSQGINLN